MQGLVVDIGNSRTVCAAWDASDRLPRLGSGSGLEILQPLTRVSTWPTPRDPEGERALGQVFAAAHEAAGSPPVIVVTVVPRLVAVLAAAAPDLRVADHRCRLPFAHRLRDIATTGADRLCNVAAAAAAGLSSALIVDVGTATTCDVMLDEVYLGGVIAPGMVFALEQLGQAASRLRPVPFAQVELEAGADTASAMAVGGFHAGVAGVEALIAGLLERYGSLPVVVTGGLAKFFAAPGRHHDPDWTLRGARVLLPSSFT